jgi:hypothetical protein
LPLVPNSQASTNQPNPQLALPLPCLQLPTDKRVGLRKKSKGKPQSVYRCDWAVREEPSGHVFEFTRNTLFETFWRTIGRVEGDNLVVSRIPDEVRYGTIRKGRLSQDAGYGNGELEIMQ